MKPLRIMALFSLLCIATLGAAPERQSNAVDWEQLPGDRNAWDAVVPFPDDTVGEPGIEIYDVDWSRVTLAHHPGRGLLFIRYQLDKAADFAGYPAFYNLYVDADGNRETGYIGPDGRFPIGADFLVQGPAVFEFSGGSQTEFNWFQAGHAQADSGENNRGIVLRIDTSLLGRPESIRFFLQGDNALNRHPEDYYPDAAGSSDAPDWFEYRLTRPEPKPSN